MLRLSSLVLAGLLVACCWAQQEAQEPSMPGENASGVGDAMQQHPVYQQSGVDGPAMASNYRYNNQDWYREPVQQNPVAVRPGGAQQGNGVRYGGQGAGAQAQRRQDKKQHQANRRQHRPQQIQQAPDYAYEDYESNDEGNGVSTGIMASIMDFFPQGLRRVFSGVSSWMSRMDGSTVAAGALTAFALGVAAAMGTAGLSGVAFTGRKLAERFDLSWDKFKEIQKLDAVSRALDFLEIEDEVCRQKAVCEVEQKIAMRNIFLWYTMRAVSGYIPGMDKYQEAAVMALEGHSCDDVYPQCPASVVERVSRLSWTDFLPSDSQVKKLAGLFSHKVKSLGVPTNLDEVASYLESRYGLVVKPDTIKNLARELVYHWNNKNKKNL